MAEQVYKQIREHIRSLIMSHQLQPGQSLPSERELGREFNASQYPARHALDELIAEGILHRIPGKGTFVKPAAEQPVKTNRIGVVYSLPNHDFMAAPFYAPILGGINDQAQREERMLLLRSFDRNGSSDPAAAFRELEREVDGFIVVDPVTPDLEALENATAETSKPVIAVNYEGTIAGTEQISFDGRADTILMVRFLLEKGHRRIAYVYYESKFFDALGNPNRINRVAGFRDAMQAAGLSADRLLLQKGAYDVESLRTLMEGPDRPSVIMAGHDMHARILYGQLRELGYSIPDDVALVGYDGTSEGELLTPALTTVGTPLAEMGRMAVMRVLEHRRGGPHTRTVLSSEIIVRESHAVPKT